MDIEQQRTAGVSGIGDMRFAAGELPREPTVDGAEKPTRRAPRAGERRAHGPATRRAWCRKNKDRESGRCGCTISGSWPAACKRAQSSAVRLSCQTMATRTGSPVLAIPKQVALALIGDADGSARLQAAGHEPEIVQRTGLILDPYFSGTSSPGCWTMCPAFASARERASWLSAPSTVGSRGSSPAANRISPMPLTPAVRCCSISIATIGTRYYSEYCVCPAPAAASDRFEQYWLMANIQGHKIPLTGIAGDQQAAALRSKPASSPAWRRIPTAPVVFC